MKRCLVDVNVCLALLAPRHVHHGAASRWFSSLQPGEAGLCRVVQLALIRLLGNRSVLGDGILSAADAWKAVADLLADERVDFVAEPAGIEAILPELFRYPVPTGKLVVDAYLSAFAIAASRKMVTADRGFQQFRGLDVTLLG